MGSQSISNKCKHWVDHTGLRWGGLKFTYHATRRNNGASMAHAHVYRAPVLLPQSNTILDSNRESLAALMRSHHGKSSSPCESRFLYIRVQPWHTTALVDVDIGGTPTDWILHFMSIGVNPLCLGLSSETDAVITSEHLRFIQQRCSTCTHISNIDMSTHIPQAMLQPAHCHNATCSLTLRNGQVLPCQ